jgi:hypothetical protein
VRRSHRQRNGLLGSITRTRRSRLRPRKNEQSCGGEHPTRPKLHQKKDHSAARTGSAAVLRLAAGRPCGCPNRERVAALFERLVPSSGPLG